ncbi:MAG: Hpt domain-containing protein [Spirochaetaceae bacterium]
MACNAERENTDEEPSFDIAALEAEYADDPDILEEIFSIFLEEAPQRLQMLRGGIAEENAAAVKKAAHSLANICGTLMAERALSLARATEAAARDEDIGEMRACAEPLSAEVEQMIGQIRRRN